MNITLVHISEALWIRMKRFIDFLHSDDGLCYKCKYYEYEYDFCIRFGIRPGHCGGCCYYNRTSIHYAIVSNDYYFCEY